MGVVCSGCCWFCLAGWMWFVLFGLFVVFVFFWFGFFFFLGGGGGWGGGGGGCWLVDFLVEPSLYL